MEQGRGRIAWYPLRPITSFFLSFSLPTLKKRAPMRARDQNRYPTAPVLFVVCCCWDVDGVGVCVGVVVVAGVYGGGLLVGGGRSWCCCWCSWLLLMLLLLFFLLLALPSFVSLLLIPGTSKLPKQRARYQAPLATAVRPKSLSLVYVALLPARNNAEVLSFVSCFVWT